MYKIVAVVIEDNSRSIERLAASVVSSLATLSYHGTEADALSELVNLDIEASESWPNDGIAFCSDWRRCRHPKCVDHRAELRSDPSKEGWQVRL